MMACKDEAGRGRKQFRLLEGGGEFTVKTVSSHSAFFCVRNKKRRNAGIAIRGLTSPARRKPGEPRDVSLRIRFSQSIVMPQNLPTGAYGPSNAVPAKSVRPAIGQYLPLVSLALSERRASSLDLIDWQLNIFRQVARLFVNFGQRLHCHFLLR